MRRELILGVSALIFSFYAWSGELIGNTYIGEKQGYIEIQSPDGKWQIEDREGRGYEIAMLRSKEQINNSRPNILIQGFPIAGDMTFENMLREIRQGHEKQGWELGPIETKRYGGKQVLTFSSRLLGKGVRGEMYLLRGEKSTFFASCTAADGAYTAAKPLCDEVIERVKY